MKARFGLYAYAVVGNHRSRRPSLGAGGQVKPDNILAVNYQDLTLIGKLVNISDFQIQLQEAVKKPKTMETVLTEHQGFLDRLMRETTVVPFQFGTILKDEAGAADHLKSAYAKYQQLLKKFKNRQEWGVRVFADLAKFKTEDAPKPRSGTGYLLGKIQAEAAERDANQKLNLFSTEIFSGLKQLAFESKVTKSAQRFSEKGEPLISVFAFLVNKSQIKKFSQEFESLQKKYQSFGLSLTSSGPWPAYNFIS